MCMEKTNTVKLDNELLSPFSVDTGLKQGDSLSPVLINLSIQINQSKMKISDLQMT